jgi:hypothetical protein
MNWDPSGWEYRSEGQWKLVIGRGGERMAVLVRTKKQAELKIVSGKHNGKS